MNSILPFPITKIEQVALHVPCIDTYIKNMTDCLGLNVWHRDTVTAKGTVFGVEVNSVAQLAFNYQAGYEFELLSYKEGQNWHSARNRDMSQPFFSHKSIHVDNIEEQKAFYLGNGLKLAQELFTQDHTNPYLVENGRKYHYVIFDSLEKFGFDLKLIQRIEKVQA